MDDATKAHRDMFAAAALTGLLAGRQYETSEYGAKAAYDFADAMLKARGSEPECSRCRELEAENKRLRSIIDSGIGPEDWGDPSENKQENLP